MKTIHTLLVVLGLFLMLISGCAGSIQTGTTVAQPSGEASAPEALSSVCQDASIRESLGTSGVRTARGTFYCNGF